MAPNRPEMVTFAIEQMVGATDPNAKSCADSMGFLLPAATREQVTAIAPARAAVHIGKKPDRDLGQALALLGERASATW